MSISLYIIIGCVVGAYVWQLVDGFKEDGWSAAFLFILVCVMGAAWPIPLGFILHDLANRK